MLQGLFCRFLGIRMHCSSKSPLRFLWCQASLPTSRMLQGLFCQVQGMGQDVLFLQKPPQVLGVTSLIVNEPAACKGYFDGSWELARVYCSSKSFLRSLGFLVSLPRSTRVLQGLFCQVLGQERVKCSSRSPHRSLGCKASLPRSTRMLQGLFLPSPGYGPGCTVPPEAPSVPWGAQSNLEGAKGFCRDYFAGSGVRARVYCSPRYSRRSLGCICSLLALL